MLNSLGLFCLVYRRSELWSIGGSVGLEKDDRRFNPRPLRGVGRTREIKRCGCAYPRPPMIQMTRGIRFCRVRVGTPELLARRGLSQPLDWIVF